MWRFDDEWIIGSVEPVKVYVIASNIIMTTSYIICASGRRRNVVSVIRALGRSGEVSLRVAQSRLISEVGMGKPNTVT